MSIWPAALFAIIVLLLGGAKGEEGNPAPRTGQPAAESAAGAGQVPPGTRPAPWVVQG
jgi:hypothetical protein